jgi:hypothetical protein
MNNDSRRRSSRLEAEQRKAVAQRHQPPQTRWHGCADWLGARKPLDLILGMCAIIVLLRWIAHLLA